MSETLTALGMDLEYPEGQELTISPVHAIVVAEGFDEEGNTVHVLLSTPGMTTVKALGYSEFAKQWLELKVMNEIVRATYAPDEE